jgi:hypothetical protein
VKSTLILTLLALLLAGACASKPSHPETVVGGSEPFAVPLPQDPPAIYSDAIEIGTVSGGKDVIILQGPYVNNAELASALRATLSAARLAATGNARYRLDATMTHLDSPFIAGDMRISAVIAYKLTDAATGAVVYERTISGVGEAGLFSSYGSAYYRLQHAQQLAVRASMSLLAQDLYMTGATGGATSSPRT